MSSLASNVFALGVLELDDTNLIEGLSESERAVQNAATNMQRNLDSVTATERQATARTLEFSGAMSALGAAFSLTSAAVSTFNFGSAPLIARMAALGGAAASAAAAVNALNVSLLRLAKNPLVTAVAAAAIAVGILVNRLVQMHRVLTDIEGTRFLPQEQLEAAQSNLRAITEEHEKTNRALRQRELIAQGVDPISLMPSAVQDQARRTQAAEKAAEARTKAAEAEKAVLDRVQQLKAERRVVLGIETQIDQIADDRERKAARELAQARLQVEVAEERRQRERETERALVQQAQALDRQVRSQSESLAVSLGLANRSDFIDDPRLRLLAEAEEALASAGGPTRPARIGGGLAIGGVRGPGAALARAERNEEKQKLDILRKMDKKFDRLIPLFEQMGVLN